MPTQTDKKILLKSLEKSIYVKLFARIIEGEDPLEDIQENIPEITTYLLLASNRYLSPRTKVPKMLSNAAFILQKLDSNGFRQELRMNRDSFYALYEMINDHNAFQSSSRNPQTDIKVQMMVALEQLGSYGNGSSVGRIARYLGVSGTLHAFFFLV